MSEHVEVMRSASGAWWRMEYRGKVELTEEEPTEQQKKLFKAAVDRAPREARPSERFHVAIKEAPQ